ncbi:MAG TPA: hypothetical protein V6C99_05175 [Oculatellaceae cyanobacterium]|jgi:hypothetical protein
MSSALRLINEVLRRTGQLEVTTLADAQTPVSQALSFMNETYWEMLHRLKVQRLLKTGTLATTPGTFAYPVAGDADINSVVSDSVMDTDTQQSIPEADYSYPIQQGLLATGRPRVFYRFGNQLCLHPTPDGIYHLAYHYWRQPVDLQADDDQTLLPPDWEKVLVLGTQSRLEKFLGESGTESYLLFRDGLDRLRRRSPMKPAPRMKGFYRGYGGHC